MKLTQSSFVLYIIVDGCTNYIFSEHLFNNHNSIDILFKMPMSTAMPVGKFMDFKF